MNQGDLFATKLAPEPEWLVLAYVDPDRGIWRAISDRRQYDTLESARADIQREQTRWSGQLHAIPRGLAGKSVKQAD